MGGYFTPDSTMKKKRVLIFIDWFWPGFKAGGPVRSCISLIEHLSDDFEFYVITSDTDYMSEVPYPSVIKDQWNKLQDGTMVYYISKKYRTPDTIFQLIKEIPADYYYLNGVFSRIYTLAPLRFIKDRSKIILSVRGMLSPGALKVKFIKKKLFILYSSLSGLFAGVTFQVSSEKEKGYVKEIFPGNSILVAPNLSSRKILSFIDREKESGLVRLICVARIAPEKNILFAIKVLKEVKTNVILDLYGPVYDESYLSICEKEIKEMPANVRIQYKGVLEPHHRAETLGSYHFLFLPSTGENFGHIILESFCTGMPVIISDQTPWRDLVKKNIGWDISLKNRIEFKEIIERCSEMDHSSYQLKSLATFEFATGYLSDKSRVEANKSLFK